MSTVYDEGPYKNWIAINFPEGFTVKCSFNLDFPGANTHQIRFNAYDAEDNAVLLPDLSFFQKVITGDTSGNSIDLRNVPVSDPIDFDVTGAPGCAVTFANLYSVPSGTAVGPVPVWGANISNIGSLSYVVLRSEGSYKSNELEPPACTADEPHEILPNWVVGETCTLTDPE